MSDSRKKPFADVLQQLSDRGILADIRRIDGKYYCVINFEMIREYKTRRSCKRFFTKLNDYANNL